MYNLLVWGMGRVSQGSRGAHQSLHPANTPHFPLSTYLVTNWLSISLSVLIRATGNWLLHPRTISTWELKASESLVTLVVMWGHCIVTSVRTVARRWPWRSPDWYLIVIIVISLKALCPSSPQSDHRLIHSNKSFVNVDPVNTNNILRGKNGGREIRNYIWFWHLKLWLQSNKLIFYRLRIFPGRWMSHNGF